MIKQNNPMPTTHTTPIDLRPYHGREFEGVLKDGSTERKCKGRVSVNKNMGVFCCQNAIDGIEAENKLGYVFSLCVQFEDEVVFNKIHVTSITILDPLPSIDPRWDWKDGEIAIRQKEQYKVCRIHNDIVVFIRDGGATGTYEIEEAYKSGYRKLPSPPTRKLTEITEEMFDKTNLIGRKVVYDGKEGQVIGMFIHPDESRSITIRGMVGSFTISQLKLIEE